MMDPKWLVTIAHGALVDVRAGYEGLIDGHNDFDQVNEALDRLRAIVSDLDSVVRVNVATREENIAQARRRMKASKRGLRAGAYWPHSRPHIFQ